MADFAIELKISAQDAGAIQALKAVEDALNKVSAATTEATKTTKSATTASEEHYGTHIKGVRSIRLLASGIVGELSPAMNELIGRLSMATMGVRLLSEHMSTGYVVAIGAAVAALTLYVKAVKDVAEWTAKIDTATSALDFGNLKSGLASVTAEIHTNIELMKTFTGRASFVVSELANMAMGAKTAGEKYFDLRDAIEQVVPWIEKLDKAQAAVQLRQIQMAQAQMGPTLQRAVGMTTPALEAERLRSEITALQSLADAQRDLIKRQTQTELAQIGASGGSPAQRNEALLRMKESLEAVDKQTQLQLRQLKESAVRATDEVFYGIISAAQKARIPMEQAFREVVQAATGVKYGEQATGVQMDLIKTLLPDLADFAQSFQTYMQQFRSAGLTNIKGGFLAEVLAPRPGETKAALLERMANLPAELKAAGDEAVARAVELSGEDEARNVRLYQALLGGGRPGLAIQTVVEQAKTQAIELGVAWTAALQSGIQQGIVIQRSVARQQFQLQELPIGFERTRQMAAIPLKEQMRGLGMKPEFIEANALALATSRTQEETMAMGEEAMIAKLFAGITEDVVKRLEQAGSGQSGIGTIVSQRMFSMIRREIGRAGLDPAFITSAVIVSMIQARQARTQLGIVEESNLATFLEGSAKRVIDAFGQGIGPGFRQKIEEGIRQKIVEAGLGGMLSEAMIKSMTDAEHSAQQTQLLQTGAESGMKLEFSNERFIRQFAANMGLLTFGGQAGVTAIDAVEKDATRYWQLTGKRLSDAQRRGLEVGIREGMEDEARGIAIRTQGGFSMKRTIDDAVQALEIEFKKSGFSLSPDRILRTAIGKVLTQKQSLQEDDLWLNLREQTRAAVQGMLDVKNLAGVDFEKQVGSLREQLVSMGLEGIIPIEMVRTMIGVRRTGATIPVLEEQDLVNLQGQINDAITQMIKRGNLAGADVERRAGDIQVQGKKIGMNILHDIAAGVATAEQSGDQMGLAVRLERAVRDSTIRVAEGAADIGKTAGERLAGGFAAGILTMERDFGTEGQNLAKLTKDIGASMQRGMSDTFFNVLTGQFKSLGDVAKQAGQSIIRGFSDAVSNMAMKSITDMIKQWLPTDFLKMAGIGGAAAAGALALPGGNAVASAGGIALAAGVPRGNEGAVGAGGMSLIFGKNIGQYMTYLSGAAGIVFGGLGLYSAATGQAGGPLSSGISGALSGLSMGIGLNLIFGLTAMTIPIIGLALGAIIGIIGGLLGDQSAKRIKSKQQGYNAWVNRISGAQTFEDLDYILGLGTAPQNVAIFKDWWLGEGPGPPRSTRDKGFDPATDLRWNTVVYENLDAVPNLVQTGSAVVRQKISQLAAEEGAPGGLVVEDVLGDIRRVAVFGGGIGSLAGRLAEARARSSAVEIFLDTLQDDALAEKLLRRLLDAAGKIDLRITRIKPFQVPGAFA